VWVGGMRDLLSSHAMGIMARAKAMQSAVGRSTVKGAVSGMVVVSV